MKRIFTIALCLCLVLSTLVIVPVSAMQTYVDLSAASVVGHFYSYSSGVTECTQYPLSNMFDNNSTTTATTAGLYENGSGGKSMSDALITIDLGAEYAITALEFTLPTSAQQTAIKTALADYIAGNQMLVAGNVYLSNTVPSSFSDTAIGSKVSLYTGLNNTPTIGVNTSSTDVLDGVNKFRYINIKGSGNTYLTFINELKVKYNVIDDGQVRFYGIYADSFRVPPANYPVSNMFDGDINTIGTNSSYTTGATQMGSAVIDLGVPRKLTKIKVILPTSAQVSALTSELGISPVSTTAGGLYVSSTEPTFTGVNINTDSATAVERSSAFFASQNTFTFDGSQEYRYITFTPMGNTYPLFIADLELEWDDRAASFDTNAAYGSSPNLSYKHYIRDDAVQGAFAEYPVSNIFDDDPNSVGWIIGRDGGGRSKPNGVVIDLGKEYYLSDINWTMPTNAEATAIATACGMTIVGSGADNYENAVNTTTNAGILCSATAPTINTASNQLNIFTNAGTAVNTYAVLGPDGWRCATKLTGTVPYRYVTLSCSQNYSWMVKDIEILDETGRDVMGDSHSAMRFYISPNVTGSYAPTAFGAYIVPLAIFNSEGNATTSGKMVSMTGTIANNQKFAVDLTDIPDTDYDTEIIAVPFVVLNGGYFYGNNPLTGFKVNSLK